MRHPHSRRAPRRASSTALIALALGALAPGCRRQHYQVDSVPELGYPSCRADAALPPGEVIAEGHLRAGPTSLERVVSERFTLRRRDCLYTVTVRQDWPLANADVEVVYDANMLPLRAWKRATLPGDRRPDGHADIRRYELRTPEVTVKRRGPDGVTRYEILRGGARPRVIIGPGRGLITAWLQRAHLPVGGRLREPALDIREEVERLRDVTLIREQDQYLPWLGRNARVYTIYGREPIFADEHDVVIGDMAGMRPAAYVSTPEAPAMASGGEPDPVNTP